tara:strand:+ start:872 stop:1396 length:525 start_codon:yes stop_codon:yes gene_type:complete
VSRARDLANGITTLAPLASPDFTGTVDLTGTTLSLDNDQISGDKVSGGTIGAGTFNGTIGTSASLASSLFNKSSEGYVILPSGIEIKWGFTSILSSFGDGNNTTHTYDTDQGGAFANATLWGIAWVAQRTTCPNITGGTSGTIDVNFSPSQIKIWGGTGSTASSVKLGFMAIGH